MKKTIVIAGAGPGLGISIARKFGANDFNIALIARKKESLIDLTNQLISEGIQAQYFIADLSDADQVKKAFSNINEVFGNVDVLEFSPTPPGGFGPLEGTTADIVHNLFKSQTLGVLHCVQAVLGSMLARNSGTIFITTGASAVFPMPYTSAVSTVMGGMRNYALVLNKELAARGIFTAHISIDAFMKKNTATDPVNVAAIYYDLYEQRDRAEVVFGNFHEKLEAVNYDFQKAMQL